MLFLYILLPLAIFLSITVAIMLHIQRPTTGEKIDTNHRKNTALLVIDFQKDFTGAMGGVEWDEDYFAKKLKALNEAARSAADAGVPILGVQHTYKGTYTNFIIKLIAKGLGAKGSKGLEFDERFEHKPAHMFHKHIGDAFISPALNNQLADLEVGTLILTGLDGNHCVKSTALGALNRGYKVKIKEEAVFAQNQKTWPKTKQSLEQLGAEFV